MHTRDNRRSKPIKPAHAPRLSPSSDAGPRPLSGRQRDHITHLHAAHVGNPKTVLHRTAVGIHRPDPKPHLPAKAGAAGRYRSGSATAQRQREKRRLNRKRIDWGTALLKIASAVFVAELVAALCFSPRLWVKQIVVEGNPTIPTGHLIKRLAIAPNTNVLALLLNQGKLLSALGKEPAVDAVKIEPRFYDGIAVKVTERQPFASVKFDSEPSQWYTLDKKLVPFRVFPGVPEANLPLVTVATHSASAGKPVGKPVLGAINTAPGLSDVSACLDWSKEQGTNFPVEKVTIDNVGKLCLNRAGGMTVLLGPGMDLEEKLRTLSLLLSKRTDLRGSAPTQIAQVNLYAYDAPALVPRTGTQEQSKDDETTSP